MDIINGREVEPTTVAGVQTISGVHQGSVIVSDGAHLVVTGTIQGTVTVQENATADINGSVQGSLRLNGNATVTVHGAQAGSVTVGREAVLTVAPRGKLAGSLTVFGRVVNHGIRGGTVSGTGTIDDTQGRVKQPSTRNGATYYEW